MFTSIILCACASNEPVPEPIHADASPGIAQAGIVQPDAATGQAEAEAVAGQAESQSGPAKTDAGNPDSSPQVAEAAGDMEVVEVEGFKEKRHCTLVRPTGSRIAQRHCRTYREDDRAREASRAWLDRIKTRPQGYHGNSNN